MSDDIGCKVQMAPDLRNFTTQQVYGVQKFFGQRSLQQVYNGGLVWCQSCAALNCVWSHLEVADPQLPGIGQFHHGNKTAGKQPLNDAYLPSICSGSKDTQSLYHKVM